MGRIIKSVLFVGGLFILGFFVTSYFIEEDEVSVSPSPTFPEILRPLPKASWHLSTPTPLPTVSPIPPLSFEPSIECEDAKFEHDGVIYVAVGADDEAIELCNYSNAKDPTWAQLKEFLLQDLTDEIPYDEDEFVCSDYAEMLHNNAEAAGIQTAWVALGFNNQHIGHAVNAFNVKNKGLVYIDITNIKGLDCPSDCIVTLREGSDMEHELLFCLTGELIYEPRVVEQIWVIW